MPVRHPAASRSHARRTRTLGSRDADRDGRRGVDGTPSCEHMPADSASISSARRVRDACAGPGFAMCCCAGAAVSALPDCSAAGPTRVQPVLVPSLASAPPMSADMQYLTGPAAELGRWAAEACRRTASLRGDFFGDISSESVALPLSPGCGAAKLVTASSGLKRALILFCTSAAWSTTASLSGRRLCPGSDGSVSSAHSTYRGGDAPSASPNCISAAASLRGVPMLGRPDGASAAGSPRPRLHGACRGCVSSGLPIAARPQPSATPRTTGSPRSTLLNGSCAKTFGNFRHEPGGRARG